MAELIEPLPNEFPDDIDNIDENAEDIHIIDDTSGNFLDITQSFMDNNNDNDNNSLIQPFINGNETMNPFGDETTLPDETIDNINISYGTQDSQGSLHLSDLQGGKKKKYVNKFKKTIRKLKKRLTNNTRKSKKRLTNNTRKSKKRLTNTTRKSKKRLTNNTRKSKKKTNK